MLGDVFFRLSVRVEMRMEEVKYLESLFTQNRSIFKLLRGLWEGLSQTGQF